MEWYNVRPPLDSVQLVQITPITMVYGTYNYSYWGESKPTYNWGASHCRVWNDNMIFTTGIIWYWWWYLWWFATDYAIFETNVDIRKS